MPDAAQKAGSARRQADRLAALRLRVAINVHLGDQGLCTPAAVGAAVGLPAPEAQKLLHRKQWREGDVAALQAIAGRLGLEVRLDEDVFGRGRGGQGT